MKKSSRVSNPFRTRFAKDIVAEVMLPLRQTGKIIILCSGTPASPNKSNVLRFLSKKGYVAIAVRYRGTWESGGVFLKQSPAQDIADVINEISQKKKVTDLFSLEEIRINAKKIIVIGSSFGGPAALFASTLSHVEKVVLLSPVIDWSVEGEDEPFDFWTRFTSQAFGGAYRVQKKSDWKKLLSHDFYNPLAMKNATDYNKKVFLIHCEDDTVVPIGPSKDFAKRVGIGYYWKSKGGHLGLNYLRHIFYWKKIEKFLKAK